MKNNLKEIRLQRFMTQQELATCVQVSRQTIGSIERGEHNPTLHLCIRIAIALKVTLDDLFWKIDNASMS